ncbi:GGDEF domain-containing protein [Paractinoplanes rishiriensis]|uniref:GGDEF domain-containing protein n=2 Tax=Paractinoplanes rishiriensis TaxID=1050105 RepID=A0A919MZL4_9ACTN|nr:GGDEF domain-containing protein [Actinoplanes rishiriensis]
MFVMYAVAGMTAAVVALLTVRHRRLTELAVPLGVILGGAAIWSMSQALAVVAPTRGQALFFSYAIFPGVAMVVAGYFWRSALSAGRLRTRKRRLLLLLVHPVLLMTAVVSDPWHHAFFRGFDIAGDGSLVLSPGPLYWLHTAYSYALMTVGTVLVVRAMRRAVRGQRRLYLWFLTGGSAPVVGNLVTLFADVDAQRFDLTPVLFLVTGLVWSVAERVGVNREREPVAYAQVIAALTDAVMVLDPKGRFLDVNPAAAGLLAALHPESRGDVIGRQWQEIAGRHFAARFTGAIQSTVTGPDGAVYDVRVVHMRSADGTCPGTVVVVRDITELERLRAELTDQAVRDGLTGVYNRRHLTAVLDEAVAGPDLSVVLIDVDHFKIVNDRYGHAVGDQVLVRVAEELAGAVRETDTVARYGGEEFVVVLPGTDALTAADRADRWRARCAAVAVDTPLGPLTVTFSAGVAELSAGDRPDDLLRHADEALYRAKRAGRDRVVVANGADCKQYSV